MAWTTTDLLSRIRVQGRLAPGHPDYTDSVLLDKADALISIRFVPAIIRVREDYYARYFNRSLVANQQAYAFPPRAYGATLREVVYIGATADDTYRIPQLSYVSRLSYEGSTGPKPDAYVVEDDRILLLPKPSVAVGTVRFCYEYRPGTLVATTAAMAVTGIGNIATGEVDGTAPTAWTTSNTFDIIKGVSPFALVSIDLIASVIHAAAHITFATAAIDATRIAIGDYVVLAGTTPIPQIPAELHSALAMAVAAEVLEELGDPDGASMKEVKVQAMISTFISAVDRRVKAPIQRLVNANSPLRARVLGAYRVGTDDGTP